MDDPATAERLGRQGAEGITRHFSAQRMTEETLSAYEELCPPPKEGGKQVQAR